jgi:hypothetical protein
MADVIEIIQGISQAVANTRDGAQDEDGKPVKIGLQREKETSISDKRIIDGFRVKMSGNILRLTYHTELPVADTYKKDFETDIHSTIAEVVSFIKKEYKKVTGNTLTLTETGKIDIEVSSTSRVRSWAVATAAYEIGGIDVNDKDDKKKDLDKAVKDWLDLGKDAKKPKNDER